jgi:N-acetylated-alpha-linked acidic dipeptidase
MGPRLRAWVGVVFLFSIYLAFLAISVDSQTAQEIRGFAPARVEAELQLEQKLQGIPTPEHAQANLRHLTSEPHMAGTDASRRVAEWLRDQYRSFGFDTEIVTYNVWLPLPRLVQLEMTEPKPKALGSAEQSFRGDPDTEDKRIPVAFNAYSPSGDVTAPVVYVNYGVQEDYHDLAAAGISVEGKIVIARYGHGFRGIKAKLAEEHKAAGLIIYSDPGDDGFAQGDVYPQGPWRPTSGIQRGSILYTQVYPGDPLSPQGYGTVDGKRVTPAEAKNLPHIPTMPINANDATAILSELGGQNVPHGWQGGLPFAYHVGPGHVQVHMKLTMEYAQRPIYDVIAKLHGTDDDEWVVLGNHHDAWVYGAADPGSGTASLLETARALGEMARSGWKPRRTIVIGEWDAEEPGLIGSTSWVEAHRAELQRKAVVYINTDVGVTGPNFNAAAAPSLKELVKDATRQVQDTEAGKTVYEAWRDHIASAQVTESARRTSAGENSFDVPVGDLGAGSDFCPFFDYAGIPSVDVGFEGDYGVYHSEFDDFFWMEHFGDPTFDYHAALARVIGVLTLRLDEADILPFDYERYGREILRAQTRLSMRSVQVFSDASNLREVIDASTQFMAAAEHESQAIRGAQTRPMDPTREKEINRAQVGVEQALLSPDGLAGRPWFKHTVYAPGSYAGYAAETLPGVKEAIDRGDSTTLRSEAASLAAALRRAALRLDEAAKLAEASDDSQISGH